MLQFFLRLWRDRERSKDRSCDWGIKERIECGKTRDISWPEIARPSYLGNDPFRPAALQTYNKGDLSKKTRLKRQLCCVLRL
jgi:hypothetical protein